MRLVIQRVSEAKVAVGGQIIAAIGLGLVILVGVRDGDVQADAESLARKAFNLRIFDDDQGKMNRSASESGGDFLVVSQFTLYANASRGRRPSFIEAAGPEVGERLYQHFVARLRALGGRVETGRFGAHMDISLVNDGPVTIILENESSA